MSDNYNIKIPKFDTITVTSKIADLKHKVEKFEYNSVSESNIAKLVKLANFSSWSFKIYKVNETILEWNTLVSDLLALNTGSPINVELDTVNHSGEVYSCMFDCSHHIENKYPNKYIEVNIARVYSNGNEVGDVVPDYIAKYELSDNLNTKVVADVTNTYNGVSYRDTDIMSSTGVKGEDNTAFTFVPDEDYVDLQTDFGQMANNISVSFWARTDDSIARFFYLFQSSVSASRGGISIYKFSGKIYSNKATGSSTTVSTPSDTVTFPSGWYHIVVTFSDTTGVRAYLDNVYVGGDTNTDDIVYTNASAKSSIGSVYFSAGGWVWANTLDGDMDNVRIYDRVLSQSEITEIYNYEKA